MLHAFLATHAALAASSPQPGHSRPRSCLLLRQPAHAVVSAADLERAHRLQREAAHDAGRGREHTSEGAATGTRLDAAATCLKALPSCAMSGHAAACPPTGRR